MSKLGEAGASAGGAAVTCPEQVWWRVAELEHARESAPDEESARRTADELHALLDDADEEES